MFVKMRDNIGENSPEKSISEYSDGFESIEPKSESKTSVAVKQLDDVKITHV